MKGRGGGWKEGAPPFQEVQLRGRQGVTAGLTPPSGAGRINAYSRKVMGCRSSVVEHLLGKEEAMGSNPIGSSSPPNECQRRGLRFPFSAVKAGLFRRH